MLLGKYPIIDQGQEYIAGYSNDSHGIFSEVPAIVFGDHTRIFKYIDFPFFLGADGVKLLKSRNKNVECKYLYYCLLNSRIPNTGYNRHFKWLKEIQIMICPIEKQKKIIDVLDKAKSLIDLRKKQIEKMDLLIKSKFIEMFGDPVTNPKGWENKKIIELSKIVTDGTHQAPKFAKEGIPFLFVSNFIMNKIDYKTSCFISEDTYKKLIKRTPLEKGDLLLTTVGSYGHPAIVSSDKNFCFQRHVAYIKPDHEIINSVYLHSAFLSDNVQRQIDNKVKGVAQKTLNLYELKNITVMVPPMEFQNKFETFVESVENQKCMLQQALEKMEINYKSLMQEYFG